MKHIFTTVLITILIALFGTAGLKAQSLQITGGDTLLVGEVGDDLTAVINLKNISTNMVEVKCSFKVLTITEGHEFSLCFTSCLSESKSTDWDFEETLQIQPGETKNTAAEIKMLDNGIKGLTRVKIIFYNKYNQFDNVEQIISFYVGVSSIEDLIYDGMKLSEPVPNPANDVISINYELPNKFNNNNASIEVYNSFGNFISSTPIIGANSIMKLNVSDLPQGKYFYLLSNDGRKSKPLSFIVLR